MFGDVGVLNEKEKEILIVVVCGYGCVGIVVILFVEYLGIWMFGLLVFLVLGWSIVEYYYIYVIFM